MMNTRKLFVLAAVGAIMLSFNAAEAKEYNKRDHLPPAQQAKVNRALAETFSKRQEGRQQSGNFIHRKTIINQDCGALTIGQIKDPKKVPREQIIVTGDVINIARNCGRGR